MENNWLTENKERLVEALRPVTLENVASVDFVHSEEYRQLLSILLEGQLLLGAEGNEKSFSLIAEMKQSIENLKDSTVTVEQIMSKKEEVLDLLFSSTDDCPYNLEAIENSNMDYRQRETAKQLVEILSSKVKDNLKSIWVYDISSESYNVCVPLFNVLCTVNAVNEEELQKVERTIFKIISDFIMKTRRFVNPFVMCTRKGSDGQFYDAVSCEILDEGVKCYG